MGWADSGFPKNRRDIKRAEKRQEIKSGLGSLPKSRTPSSGCPDSPMKGALKERK